MVYKRNMLIAIVIMFVAGFALSLISIAATPMVEKEREVTKTREVTRWVEKSDDLFGGTLGKEIWVSAETLGYDIVRVHVERNGTYVKGYIKVLTEPSYIDFEILTPENFDIISHDPYGIYEYDKEFESKDVKELNFTWYPSKNETLYYFTLKNWLSLDTKVYWEASEYWTEPITVEEEYITTETYLEPVFQPANLMMLGLGSLLILGAIILFPIWLIMRWKVRRSSV